MLKLCAIASIAIISAIMSPLSALAYTQQDADACTPDAMRLCQNAIPDEARVAHCLAQNRHNLSPACQIVFSRPATARSLPAGTMPATGRPLDIRPTDY